MMRFSQALAVEGDVLLLKPFLDPTPHTIQPQLGSLGLSRVWQTEKTSPRLAISISQHHCSSDTKLAGLQI
jgi:hypothetical protein